LAVKHPAWLPADDVEECCSRFAS